MEKTGPAGDQGAVAKLHAVEVSARWVELMQRSEDGIPLDEAVLLISARANPALEVATQLGRLDQLAGLVGGPDVSHLRRVLFDQLGLRGDREHYDDPANSYLDRVLERRRGIPISLSVILIEVGRRCGIPLEAVGMPGHFLVRDPTRPEQLIDAFDRGRQLDHAACERLLRAVAGGSAQLTTDMLATTGTWAILARMLANLDRSFEVRQDRQSLAWVSDLRMHIPKASLADRMQLAGRLAALGRFDAAASVLEEAASATIGQEMQSRLVNDATGLRARLN